MDKPTTVEQACDLFWDGKISYEQLRALLVELPPPPDSGPPPETIEEFYREAEKDPDPNDGFWIAALELNDLITPEQELELHAASAKRL